MELQSALWVKRELSSFFDAGAVRGPGRRFAIGVASPHAEPTEYRIAVRARAESDLSETALGRIERAAPGEVDVRFTGPIVASAQCAESAVRGAAIGASVAHFRCTAGTLGFFARKNSDRSIGFVSNNHVLAAEDKGREADEILHPAPSDNGLRPRDVVGRLAGDYPRLRRPKVMVDCAFARLVNGRHYDPRSLTGGRVLSPATMPPYVDPLVSKIGRTTGLTTGRISAFDLDGVRVDYSFGNVRFNGQIEVESVDGVPFSLGGDSGSLVFTSAGCHPVGLLYANSGAGGPGNCGLSYLNPIDAVLTALGVTFLT